MTDTSPQAIQVLAAVLFGIALLHTFAARQFERLAARFPRHSGLFHLLGEVEVVFGFWAIVLVLLMAVAQGPDAALAYAESRQYTEPLFVFVVMVVAGTRPILQAVRAAVDAVAARLPRPIRSRAPGCAWRPCRWPARSSPSRPP
jgi:hypothetical protein